MVDVVELQNFTYLGALLYTFLLRLKDNAIITILQTSSR